MNICTYTLNTVQWNAIHVSVHFREQSDMLVYAHTVVHVRAALYVMSADGHFACHVVPIFFFIVDYSTPKSLSSYPAINSAQALIIIPSLI